MKKGEKGFIVVLKSVLLRGILTLQSNQVKRTPQEFINEFIIQS